MPAISCLMVKTLPRTVTGSQTANIRREKPAANMPPTVQNANQESRNNCHGFLRRSCKASIQPTAQPQCQNAINRSRNHFFCIGMTILRPSGFSKTVDRIGNGVSSLGVPTVPQSTTPGVNQGQCLMNCESCWSVNQGEKGDFGAVVGFEFSLAEVQGEVTGKKRAGPRPARNTEEQTLISMSFDPNVGPEYCGGENRVWSFC